MLRGDRTEARRGIAPQGCALLALLTLLTSSGASAQGASRFDALLRDHSRANEREQARLVRTFTEEQHGRGGFPIRERSGEVVFVYVAERSVRDVRIVGDFHTRSFTNPYWDLVGEPLTHVGSLFYLRRTFEPDARLDYRFVVDGEPTLDPLNPRTIASGAGNGEASELVMPAHRIPAETLNSVGVARGTLQVLQEPWAVPAVTVYLPPIYDTTRAYPTIYTVDGAAWRSSIGLPTTLDNLIAAKRIPPTIAVMVDAAQDRSTWYHCNPDHLAYVQRVVAYVDAHYATRSEPAARVHVGTSSGGKATLHIGVALPHLFGNVGILSPSLTPTPGCLEPYLAGRRPLPKLRAWIQSGTYEGAIHRDSQALAQRFRESGAQVAARVEHQGHSFGAWREAVVGMLESVLGHQSAR